MPTSCNTLDNLLSNQELLALDAQGLEPVLMQISELLRARHWTLATAESCTGGLIASVCTALHGSSQWFEYGVVSYANTAKTQLLGVPAALIAEHGAVSEAVARAMAYAAVRRSDGTTQASSTRASIAVTGVAGPGGGSADKPVGLVWFAWCCGGHTYSTSQRFEGTRAHVRAQSVRYALTQLLKLLQSS